MRKQEETFEASQETFASVIGAWEMTLKRLRSPWVEAHRENLALGAAAYGLYMGKSPERVRADLETLSKRTGDSQIGKHLNAVVRTIRRYVRGERIAWRKFYALANLQPPRSISLASPEVLSDLKALRTQAKRAAWKNKGGLTDRDVYLSLIEIALFHGMSHENGVKVSIAVRALSLEARVAYKTVYRSLERLDNRGLVARASKGSGAMSGALMLIVDRESDAAPHPTEDIANGAVESDCIESVLESRWGTGRLGKLAGPILEALIALQPCTRSDVAKAIQRKSRGLRDAMNRLVDEGIVLREGNIYSLPEDYEDRLYTALLFDGTLETDDRHKEQYKKERKMFKEIRSRQKVR